MVQQRRLLHPGAQRLHGKGLFLGRHPVKVYRSGARTGNYTLLVEGAGQERTFSIETGNMSRAVIHWKVCTLVSGGVEWCNPLMNDYID